MAGVGTDTEKAAVGEAVGVAEPEAATADRLLESAVAGAVSGLKESVRYEVENSASATELSFEDAADAETVAFATDAFTVRPIPV